MKMIVMFFVLVFSIVSFARDYEIFDGRNYNGIYYPKIDIIVWRYDNTREAYTLQFQVYWKGHQVDMAYEFEDSTGQKIMKVQYLIPERKEVLCRRVPAPGNFGPIFKIYKETGDKDMDNTILSMEDLPKKGNFGDRVIVTPPKYDASKCPSEEGETNQDPFAVAPAKATASPVDDKKAIEGISKPQTQEELNKQFNMFN